MARRVFLYLILVSFGARKVPWLKLLLSDQWGSQPRRHRAFLDAACMLADLVVVIEACR